MTTKTLADFFEVYRPKSPDEQKFVDKHVVIKHKDRNGNGDDVFNAKNVKKADRKKERHGYEPGEDEKVYEEVEDLDEAGNELMGLKNRIASNQKKMRAIPGIHPDKKRLAIQIEKDKKRHNELFNRMMGKNESIDEKTLTPAEMKKREEVVKAIKRGNPKMDKSIAYAIATKTAKRVAEEADLDEDFEQIDEISSKVVKNYLKKAWAGRDSGNPDRKGGVGFDHRRKGINLAYNFALPRNRQSDKEAAQAAAKLARRQNELRRQGKVVEDFEQIDELSRATLASYAKKASDPKKANSKKVEVEFHNARKDAKHYERLRQAWSAYGRPEVDSDSPIASLHRKAVATRDRLAYAKDMRKKYVHKAIDKLATEEVSQIDEMRGTSYARPSKSFFRGPTAPSMPREKTEREKETDKGLAAIQAAFAKARKPKPITAEELATSFIDRYMPEQADMPALTNEEKLVTALLDLNISETIASDVLALHNTLDEQNQRLLIDNIMEGQIDDVVDFAIQNRN